MRALEDTVPENENLRTQEFIHSLNTLLDPLEMTFGDYATLDFFVRSTSGQVEPSSDQSRALDIWKNFLWEWTTERAFPFETSYKHKSTSHVADTLLFERASMTSVETEDPDRVMQDTFDEFAKRVESSEFHLGQFAIQSLEELLISEKATYLTDSWPKEFLDVVTSVAILYYEAVRERSRRVFRNDSFSPSEPFEERDLEFAQGMFELYVNDLFFRAFDRANVLSAPSLNTAKSSAAEEKFQNSRDRTSQWKFIVADLFYSFPRNVTAPLQLR